MNREELPLLRHMAEFGPQDPVFDLLILLGPVVIVVVPLLGRNAASVLLAVAYIAAFLLYTGYKAVTRDATD